MPDQQEAHRLVATAVVVSAATTMISQEWFLQVRDFIEQRTSKTPPAHGNAPDGKTAVKWAIAIGGLWIVFTAMVDLGDTAELAVAFALVMMGSVLMVQGPQALSNLGFLTIANPGTATAAAPASKGVPSGG